MLAIVDNKVSDADAAKVKGYDGNIVVRVREGRKRHKDFGTKINFIKFVPRFPNFIGKSDLITLNSNEPCTNESSI